MHDSMNPIRLPKAVLLPDWARRDMQDTKGDRVYLFRAQAVQDCYQSKLRKFQ
jgi:hypothetical protein